MKLYPDKRVTRSLPLLLLLLMLVTSVFLSGCGQTPPPGGQTNQSPPAQQHPGRQATNQPQQQLAVPVYYLKSTNNGDYLVREVHFISPGGNPMLSALQQLISGQPTTPGASRVLPKETKILGIKVNNGLATVNFSSDVLKANVGAEAEELGIQSIVDTLTEFPEIRRVAFEVEGKVDQRTQDWWGHVGLYDQPFKKDVSRVYEPAIWITHPTAGQSTGMPLLVKGSARVPDGKLGIRLLDENGKVLFQGNVTTGQSGLNRGVFETSLKFTPPAGGKGKLEVFSYSPQDGSEQNKVSVPVRWP